MGYNKERREFLTRQLPALLLTALGAAGCVPVDETQSKGSKGEPIAQAVKEIFSTQSFPLDPQPSGSEDDKQAIQKKDNAPEPSPTAKVESLQQALDEYTRPFSKAETPGFERVRVLDITDQTSGQILGEAPKKPFGVTYPKLLIETAYNWEVIALGPKGMNRYFQETALGIKEALKQAFPDKNIPLVVGLSAGHMSNALRGLGTYDTGTSEGGIRERTLNYRLAETTAFAIDQDPDCANWIPVLNAEENGFPVDQLENEPGMINDFSAIGPLNWFMDQIGKGAKADGANMIDLAIHHNGGAPTHGGWIFYPTAGNYVQQAKEIGSLMANRLGGTNGRLKGILPGYGCRISTSEITRAGFLWDLDDGSEGNKRLGPR